MMTKWFAGMNIGQVHFNERNGDRQYGVTQSHAGMSIGGRIDNDKIDRILAGGMDTLDQNMFGIALANAKAGIARLGLRA
jgi:hypothetical protein